MVAPLIRLLLQGLTVVAPVLYRSFKDAYRIASQNAKRSNAQVETETTTKIKSKIMTYDEACKILQVTPDTPRKDMELRFEKLFQANDIKKGGSPFLQSKVYFAKECLEGNLK
jgi:import inner membrane translocase subunit TIM16